MYMYMYMYVYILSVKIMNGMCKLKNDVKYYSRNKSDLYCIS